MGGGVFRSSYKGKNWTPVNNGLTHFLDFDIRAFTMDGTTHYTGTLGRIFRSVDNGIIDYIYDGLRPVYIDALTSINTNIFAGISYC